jgi:S1-C subfamily serine protease
MKRKQTWLAAGLLLLLAACTPQMKPYQSVQPAVRPEAGLRLKVVDAQPYFKDTDQKGDTGLLVLAVKPESAAGRAGVRSGDLLLSIDGRRVSGSADAFEAMRLKKPGDIVSFQVLREKETVTVAAPLDGPGGKP